MKTIKFTGNESIAEACDKLYPESLLKIENAAIFRDDSGKVVEFKGLKKSCSILRSDGVEIGSVGPDYFLEQPLEVLQNTFGVFLESGEVMLEQGIVSHHGARMSVTGRVKGTEIDVVSGDTISAQIRISTSFDGSLSNTTSFNGKRWICGNEIEFVTIKDAAGYKLQKIGISKANNAFKLKHSKNFKDRRNAAMGYLIKVKAIFNESVDLYKQLAKQSMTDNEQRIYFEDVFKNNSKTESDELNSKIEQKIQYVINIRDTTREQELLPMHNTRWEAYNSVTNYLTHHYGKTADTRHAAITYGRNVNVSQNALLKLM